MAGQQPHKPALVVCGKEGGIVREVTYAELLARLASAAGYLHSLGLQKGDRVALAFDNSLPQLLVSWAAWSIGIVTVPLDTKRDTPELIEYKTKLTGATQTLRELPEASAYAGWVNGTDHEALILFTSGTTAYPKGTKLSLQNLLVNAEGIIEWLRVSENDRFVVLLPLHHINSTTFCLATLLAGGTVVVPPAYSASNFWELCAATGATLTSIVQSIVFDQLQRTKEFKQVQHALKLSRIQIGSAPVVSHAAREFIRTFSIPLQQGYGQTETALRVTGVPMGLPRELYEQLVEDNSIGTPMNWAQVEIADECGKILGEGTHGELVIKGPAVMSGYLGGETAFRNGYFLSGDIGYYKTIAGRKFFYLVGRKKEIIIKGGINISPVAVENGLKKISEDLDQAYVVGVPDERYGEEIGAALCWKQDVEPDTALRALKVRLALGTQALARYETPVYLTTLTHDELPTTSTGKVQRSVLKKQLARERFEEVHELYQNTMYRFAVITPHSKEYAASRELYNRCWQPLTMSPDEYKQFLQRDLTLAAVDSAGTIAGQISFHKEKDALVCVSICSANYKPQSIPEVAKMPTQQEVEEYVRAGNDAVINFHTKLGAEVLQIIPQGRPEDKSALGYLVRMRYEVPSQPTVDERAPVSRQLIQMVLLLAHDLGLSQADALSRPGGLANHVASRRVAP